MLSLWVCISRIYRYVNQLLNAEDNSYLRNKDVMNIFGVHVLVCERSERG